MANRQIAYTARGNNSKAVTVTYLGKEVSLHHGAIADDPIVAVIVEAFHGTYPNGSEDTVHGTVEISA